MIQGRLISACSRGNYRAASTPLTSSAATSIRSASARWVYSCPAPPTSTLRLQWDDAATWIAAIMGTSMSVGPCDGGGC